MFERERQDRGDMKAIVFQLMNQPFGIDVNQVRSIERVMEVTKTPRAPRYMKGVIHLRGSVIPIIDLKLLLMSVEEEISADARVILLNMDGSEVGVIVDAANDVIDIPGRSIQPPPPMTVGVQTMEYWQGVVQLEDKLLILLDLSKTLDLEEIKRTMQEEGIAP